MITQTKLAQNRSDASDHSRTSKTKITAIGSVRPGANARIMAPSRRTGVPGSQKSKFPADEPAAQAAITEMIVEGILAWLIGVMLASKRNTAVPPIASTLISNPIHRRVCL